MMTTTWTSRSIRTDLKLAGQQRVWTLISTHCNHHSRRPCNILASHPPAQTIRVCRRVMASVLGVDGHIREIAAEFVLHRGDDGDVMEWVEAATAGHRQHAAAAAGR